VEYKAQQADSSSHHDGQAQLLAGPLLQQVPHQATDLCALCWLPLLQQLLESAGVPYTGINSDFAVRCSNRLAITKVGWQQ